MSLVVMFTHMTYTLKEKEEKEILRSCRWIFRIRYLVKVTVPEDLYIFVLCNKGLVSQDSSTVETENFDPVPRSETPWFLQCRKLCDEAEDVERHFGRCWCKEVDEWGTGWVCHPEAGLLDSLASGISVELTVGGSRFPRLLCSVRVMLSHRWFCPCCMQHAAWSESPTAAVETSLAELFYTYLLNCPFNWWTQTQQILTSPQPNRGGGGMHPQQTAVAARPLWARFRTWHG